MQFQLIAGAACLDFVNTLDNRARPGDELELLQNYSDLASWAQQTSIISARRKRELLQLAESDPEKARAVHQDAIELRECLHRLFDVLSKGKRPAASGLALFDTYLRGSYSNLRLQRGDERFRLGWDDKSRPLDSVLWPIIESAVQLLTSNQVQLVRECADDTCRWLFVDRSKNHSRRWCDMKNCGNRRKARNFYARRRQVRAPAATRSI